MKNKGLGRGLDALLANNEEDNELNNEGLMMLPTKQLVPGKYQPRTVMNEQTLNELTESIKSQGIMQPILVRKAENEKYEIIAGERRWQASKRAGINLVPVLIKEIPDVSALAMALIENIQREDLNPMEEANALHRLREEFSMTHQEAAAAVGRSRAAVSNLLRLRNLNEDVKRLVENCDLEMGHARALLPLEGGLQSDTANSIVERGLSVRETEQLVRRLLRPAKEKPQPEDSLQAELDNIEKLIKQKLDHHFLVKHTASGKGKLVIDYASVEDLKGIVKKLK